jgi:hypothetical protein
MPPSWFPRLWTGRGGRGGNPRGLQYWRQLRETPRRCGGGQWPLPVPRGPALTGRHRSRIRMSAIADVRSRSRSKAPALPDAARFIARPAPSRLGAGPGGAASSGCPCRHTPAAALAAKSNYFDPGIACPEGVNIRCKQDHIALVVSRGGLPLGCEVFAGAQANRSGRFGTGRRLPTKMPSPSAPSAARNVDS